MRLQLLRTAACVLIAASGCAMGTAEVAEVRDSGQSRLMDQTFAGKNACNPDNHERPFIIEWDATDRSSFEAVAANDIIFVRYEGCDLTVLDECRNESIRGKKGSYLPPEWTAGGLETIAIETGGELAAKLPLGMATLGARVASGESFHMEYFVAGTKRATRDAVYRDDLRDDPGCRGATHFVHAYNLGAFALGTKQGVDVEGGGSVYGFGAQGQAAKSRGALKKGGDLSTCSTADATEVRGCQAPIRLSLRKVRDGSDPNKASTVSSESDPSLGIVGELAKRLDMSDDARAHVDAAHRKLAARDGNGCLAELDKHAHLDPTHKSTAAGSPLARTRSLCLMLAGQCMPGRSLLREHLEQDPLASTKEPGVDITVIQMMNRFCEGPLPPREDFQRSIYAVSHGLKGRDVQPAYCAAHLDVFKKHWSSVSGLRDELIDTAMRKHILGLVPKCFEQAKDCSGAWKAYGELIVLKEGLEGYFSGPKWKGMTPEQQRRQMKGDFKVICPTCPDPAQ